MKRADALVLLLVLGALQLLGALARACARPRSAPAPRWVVERAREVDEAFEDAQRLNEARGPLVGELSDCWCGESGAQVLPGWGVVCVDHYAIWSADA